MTIKAVRETVRIAEACGIENVRVVKGDPHARITGTVRGVPIPPYVTSISTAHVRRPRFFKTLRADLRRIVARMQA